MTRDATADIEFREVDLPLREDVRMLGALLGEVIRTHAGQARFDLVERARKAARAWHRGDPRALQTLEATTSALPPDEASELTRAFSEYFGLANMAEQVHRIRRRRQRAIEQLGAQPGSLEAVLRDLAAAGVDWPTVRAALASLRVVPVLTAHPTRAIRRSLLAKEQRIARALVDRLEAKAVTPIELAAAERSLRTEVSSAWQTEEHLVDRPTVADEAEYVLFYLVDVIYRIVPALERAMVDAVHDAYGPEAAAEPLGPLVRFGSWVGGDMDGNPNVGAETISAALQRHRDLLLPRYRDELRRLAERLTHSKSRARVEGAVLERIGQAAELVPEAAATIPQRFADMPYRSLCLLMAARIEASLEERPGGYRGPEELETDVRVMLSSLAAHDGMAGGGHLVERLLWRVQTFGFHLASLDVRQDSLVHRRAVGALLGDGAFPDRPAADRVRILGEALERPHGLAERGAALLDAEVRDEGSASELVRSLRVFGAIGAGLRRYGRRAVGPYIISMAQAADDALAVLVLARAAGLADERGGVPIDVAPLFETVDDLSRSADVTRALYEHPIYREHLRARGDEQIVMLGYSDSSKDGGMAASRWALQQAQSRLLAEGSRAGVASRFFHGRGGTAGRGGSKPRQAILAEPPGAVQGCLRVTEQGEIIHAKYGLRGIAERTLELMVGATLEAGLRPAARSVPDVTCSEVMHTIASVSRRSYRALVYEHPRLYEYFRTATPIDVIERMKIGSRPSSRRAQRGIEDLRAIPWVFAWTQSRHMIPGWFGLGSGLEAALERVALDELRDLRARWPFFANLLSDAEMVLAKADLAIARRYAELAPEPCRAVFTMVEEEFERTRRSVLQILGTDELLDGDPVIQRNIRLRNPYVDPMSLLQVDLLRRWRATDRTDVELERALHSTVRGIARGLQNTG